MGPWCFTMTSRNIEVMQDIELYRYLLDLESPWTVERIKLDIIEQRVDVWAAHAEGLRWACPECGASVPLYKHAPERTWHHLDSCQFETFLHARPPRRDILKPGFSGRRIRGWSRWSRRRGCSGNICPRFWRTLSTWSQMRWANGSIPRFKRLRKWPTASGTARTSKSRSIFIASP